MARTNNLSNFLTDVADAIRTAEGSSGTIDADEFDTRIEALSGGADLSEYFTETIASGTTSVPGYINTLKKFPAFENIGTSCAYMFYSYPLSSVDLNNFDTTGVTSMSNMFSNAVKLQSVDISNFNMQSVNDVSSMFNNCSSLKSDIVIPSLPIVTSMSNMFSGCSNIEKIDLSNIDTRNVTSVYGLFSRCTKLKTLIHNFNFSRLDNTESMFYNCTSLQEIDFSNVPTGTSMSRTYGMFSGCTSLRKIDLSGFTAKMSTCAYMFSNCTSLQELDVRGIQFSTATSSSFYNGIFDNVPTNCEIIVKDNTERTWVLARRSDFTNVKTVAEYEAEQNA